MKDLRTQAFICLAAAAWFFFSAWAISHGETNYPITKYVNDYAHVLSSSEVTNLERKMTGTNTVILTVPDLGGESIEDFSIRRAKEVRLGSKANDGILVTMALAERKLRIDVGYGKEETVTDTRSFDVIQQAKPFLAKGREQWAKAFEIIINGVK